MSPTVNAFFFLEHCMCVCVCFFFIHETFFLTNSAPKKLSEIASYMCIAFKYLVAKWTKSSTCVGCVH